MTAWDRAVDVIVIDCVVTGGAAGTVYIWDARSQLPVGRTAGSTHALGVAEAVELARALRRLPARLRVYGIEGQNFEMGSEACVEVQQAIKAVVHRIVAEFDSVTIHGQSGERQL